MAVNSTVTVQFVTNPTIIQDVLTYWLEKTTTTTALTTLSAPMGATDTTASFSGAVSLAVGDTIEIDSEPIAVTGVNPLVLSRGTFPLDTPATHVTGAPVYKLTYPSPYAMFIAEAVAPWIRNIVSQIASQGISQTLPVPSGSVTIV